MFWGHNFNLAVNSRIILYIERQHTLATCRNRGLQLTAVLEVVKTQVFDTSHEAFIIMPRNAVTVQQPLCHITQNGNTSLLLQTQLFAEESVNDIKDGVETTSRHIKLMTSTNGTVNNLLHSVKPLALDQMLNDDVCIEKDFHTPYFSLIYSSRNSSIEV